MRVEQVTFTRFLASIAIVIYHFGLKIYPFNTTFLFILFKISNVGVSYFFILSGFVMVVAYSKKSEILFFDFIKNRVARIYPAYLIATIALVIINLFFHYKINEKNLFLNIFCLQAWIPARTLSFNAPAWSVSVEFFFYAVFPFLYNFIYSKKKLRTIAGPILLFWIFSQIFLHFFTASSFYHSFPSRSHSFIFYFPIMHLNEFLIGNLCGLFFLTKASKYVGNFDLLITLLFFLIIVALTTSIPLNFHNGLLAILFVPLIVLLSLNNGAITKTFKLKPFVFLGEISFGIYILQNPIFFWMKNLYAYMDFKNINMQFYMSTAMLIITSAVTFEFIEAPVRKRIRSIHLNKYKKRLNTLI